MSAPKSAIIYDFDGTLYNSEINSGQSYKIKMEADLIPDKIINRELYDIYASTKNYDKILLTGRHDHDSKRVIMFCEINGLHFDDYLFYKHWGHPVQILFYLSYWHWKFSKIVDLMGIYNDGILVIEDDAVICQMCQFGNIPVVHIGKSVQYKGHFHYIFTYNYEKSKISHDVYEGNFSLKYLRNSIEKMIGNNLLFKTKSF